MISSDLDWSTVKYYIQNAPQIYGTWWLNLVRENPGHVVVETALIFFCAYILLFKKTLNTKAPAIGITHLSEKEVEELISDWIPDSLVPEVSACEKSSYPVIDTFEKGNIIVLDEMNEKKVLVDMATFDFLGFGQSKEIKQAAVDTMEKYGCGSCGPRGFYGTIDVHLKLEEEVAHFMKAEAAISYSDSAATTTSCIAAFAKKGDLILADKGVHESVHTGLDLSRSTVRYFDHNDMNHLERLLKEVEEEDLLTGRNKLDQRRFIVVEGLYRNYGDICPLPKLLKLKNKYHFRLIMDEAFSFGVLGDTGRGVTEYFQLESAKCVDIMTISLANTLASIGGVCVGQEDVVDHQRLSGAGYCFSAAAPPFTAASASKSLELLTNNGPGLIKKLRENSRLFHDSLKSIGQLKVISSSDSPIIHAVLKDYDNLNIDKEEHLRQLNLLRKIADICKSEGFAVAVSHYMNKERYHAPPTIRFTINATRSTEQLKSCILAIKKAVKIVL